MSQPNRLQIARGIADFLRSETNFQDPTLIKEDTRLLELGIIDSLAIMSVVAFCETAYQCQISADLLAEEFLETPLALASLVERVRSAGPTDCG